MNSTYILASLAQLFGVFLLFVQSGPARLAGVAVICAGGFLYRRETKRVAQLSGPIEHKPSTLQRLLLKSFAVLFIVPPTVAACYGTIMLLAIAGAATRGDLSVAPASPILSVLIVLLGCAGVQSLWGLYFHFVNNQDPPKNTRPYWFGLFSGIITSAFLIAASGGDLIVRLILFGWPLVPTAFFMVLLRRRKMPPNNSFKPKPLRSSA